MDLITILGFILMLIFFVAGLIMIFFGLGGVFAIAVGYLIYGIMADRLSIWLFIILLVLAFIGELAEWVLSLGAGRKMGASKKALVGAVIGAFIGAIILSPMLAIGSVAGLLLGLFLGAFITELIYKKKAGKAFKSAIGVFLGRIGGTVVKFVIGLLCIIIVLFNL